MLSSDFHNNKHFIKLFIGKTNKKDIVLGHYCKLTKAHERVSLNK